jgi:alpha-galactosidase
MVCVNIHLRMIDCQQRRPAPRGRAGRGKAVRAGALTLMLSIYAHGAASRVVSRGSAFVSADADAKTWTIGNDRLQASFRLTAANDFVLDRIVNPASGRVFNSAAAPDSTVTLNGATTALGSSAGGWTLESASASESGAGVQLVFTFRSARLPLTVLRSYVCYPDAPAIEMWTTFRATGSAAISVSNLNTWQLTFPSSAVHYAFGLREDAAGNPVDEAFTLRDEAIDAREALTLTEPNRSTEHFLPLIAADADADEFFGGLLWSGSWQMTVQRRGTDVQATAGHPRVTTSVDAAHSLETPHGFVGFTAGSRSDVSEALRTFVVQGLRGGRGFAPLVTYNTWFAYGTDIDERSMVDEMVAAASLGVELFVIDAGWYLGAGTGTDFDSGLGTWEVDPARFPHGLATLRAQAHALGMQFGLWVEPERVDRATVDRPGRAREEWLAKSDGSYQAARTAQVCLASAAARQWMLDQLTRLLDEVQPDYLKWDNNLWVNCNRSGHGHGAADGNFAHVTALYDVLGTLRARYPTMTIENCSQGGNRLDFGMLRYTDTAWMDDRSGPAVHVRHNLQGLMTFFPPAYLLSFVLGTEGEPLLASPDLALATRSRMPGILGLTYRAADLTEMDRDGLAQEIGLYTRVRETLRDASGRLLTEQAAPDGGPAWDALQEQSSTSGEAVIFAFQNDSGMPRVTLRPERLDSAATYIVSRLDGTLLGSATGAEVMADGIEIDGAPESAAHVVLLRKGLAAVERR